MIRVPAEVRRTFTLWAPPQAAFAFLSDVPRWAALFPGVERVVPLAPGPGGEEVWRWEMAPMGPPGAEVRTVYACSYTFNAEALRVTWEPVPGVGNAEFAGGGALAASGGRGTGGTAGELWLEASLEVPAPRFVAGVVRAAVGAAFGRMTDQFLARLRAELAA